MPMTMWKGAISFGLVSIPVRVFPCTEEKSLRFNQLHDADGGRIRMRRVCSVCGEEVPFEHIVKGFEVDKDRYVTMTDEDFDAVQDATWVGRERCRERDECRAKLVQLEMLPVPTVQPG